MSGQVTQKTKWYTSDNQEFKAKGDAEQVQKRLNFVIKMKEFEKLHLPLSFGVSESDYTHFYRFRKEIKEFYNKHEE